MKTFAVEHLALAETVAHKPSTVISPLMNPSPVMNPPPVMIPSAA